ncbi:MAG: peptidase S41 [Flavobacteriales bacterium]|nr:peptidase S41 [Flavobacteriales bacterium]
MNSNNPFFNYLPILCACFLISGLFLGKFLYQDSSQKGLFHSNSGGKVDEVIENVVELYVDPTNENELTEYAIKNLLAHLDPHSSYIPAENVKTEQEQLNGKFEGIGIEFRIIDDTLMVVNAIQGGPSQKAGIKSGDRIIGLDNQKISLGKLPSDSLVKKLRGKSGSNVDLIILRPFDEGEVIVSVTRGEIPIFSVDAQIMLSQDIGYIRINRFSSQTYTEFKNAAKTLQKKGARKLILDVRDNPGGYLRSVVDICDDLLKKGKNIVYTKGENDRETYNSKKDGTFQDMKLAVLINHKSASASEILAGALQDHDRAVTIGRRTFGKGLVQSIIRLNDNSRINLTTARYYTPSGRCIQKPFEKDNINSYYNEETERWKNGELYSKDSIKINDSLEYKTMNGRLVYGGGGIIPDVFVPYDTSMNSDLLFEILSKDLIRNYVVKYFTAKKIKGFDYQEVDDDFIKGKIITRFKEYCNSNQITWSEKEWNISAKYITNKLSAYILRVKFGNNGYFRKSAETDEDILAALKTLSSPDSGITFAKKEQ